MKAIQLTWIENGKRQTKEINRKVLKTQMWVNINTYPENNKISKMLFNCIEKITIIEADLEEYETSGELPMWCYVDGEETISFNVDIDTHPVILAMFLQLCKRKKDKSRILEDCKVRKIKMKWIENGMRYEKEIPRAQFKNKMQTIMDAFEGNNEISTSLYNVADDVLCIEISKDMYKELDTPWVLCKLKDKKQKAIPVNKKYHPLMWKILMDYCK